MAVKKLDAWQFDAASAQRDLARQFGTAGLAGFGCEGMELALGAAGALVAYCRHTQQSDLPHVTGLRVERESEFIAMDAPTRRNLEITRNAVRAPSRPRSSRCSTAPPPPWAGGACATGCTIPCATPRSSSAAMPRSARCCTRLAAAPPAPSRALRGVVRRRAHHRARGPAHRAPARPRGAARHARHAARAPRGAGGERRARPRRCGPRPRARRPRPSTSSSARCATSPRRWCATAA